LSLHDDNGRLVFLAETEIANIKFAVIEKSREPCVFAIIQAAGWPIWPLLLASILAVAFIIERSVALRRSKIVPSGLLQSIAAEYRQSGATEDMMAAWPSTRRSAACWPPACAT
jgi:hypothetical protein